jgi:hypothetical protein
MAAGDQAALVHISDDRCRVMSGEGGEAGDGGDRIDPENNAALRSLLEECDRAPCTFDVYYRLATGPLEAEDVAAEDVAASAYEPAGAVVPADQFEGTEPQAQDVSNVVEEAKAIYRSLSVDETDSAASAPTPAANRANEQPVALEESAGTGEGAEELLVVREEIKEAGAFEMAEDAVAMAEVKRLMGDIARTVEVAAQAIEQRDSFSIYLRAGQLKIADRYPFLDPFGAEFEYLGGEIAFIGDATPEQFVEGLTEALRLAVEAVAQTSTQSARLRDRINEDLRWLYERHQQEFQQYGLDKTIGELISA